MLTGQTEEEIKALADRFGEPARWRREYSISPEGRDWAKKMVGRSGEIILVVPSGNGRVWLHTKRPYPASVYRLPSGGVHKGENIETAASREAFEEMGFKPGIERFVGLVKNVFKLDGETVIYPSYIFQTAPLPGSPQVTDRSEGITGFIEIAVPELLKIAEQLDSLGPDWQPWGHFRAAPHALVKQVLSGKE